MTGRTGIKSYKYKYLEGIPLIPHPLHVSVIPVSLNFFLTSTVCGEIKSHTHIYSYIEKVTWNV